MRCSDRRKTLTIMLVPHSEREMISFKIPLVFVKALLGVFIVTALVIAGFAVSYKHMQGNMAELQQLREVNKAQQEKLQALTQDTAALQEKMKRLQELDSQVRQMMGIENAEQSKELSPEGGQGGPVSQEESPNPASILHGGNELASRGGSGKSVNELERNIEQLKKEMEQSEASLSELKDRVAERQAYLAAIPSIWPTYGSITSYFGYRRSPWGWGSDFHPGVDIAGDWGTPIVATGDGVVTMAGWYGGYGKTVMIDHGYGYQTLYGHNSSIEVSVGQTVKKGEVIAYMGSTGASTGPHCHYEVILNGERVNPINYLP